LAKRGGRLHDELERLIESRLDEMAELESVGNTDELNRIRSDAPRAIPGPLMRTLWRLLLAGRVKSWARDFNLHRWRDRLKRDGLTTTLRLELHDILTPRVSLREPFRVTEGQDVSTEPQRLKDLVEWDVVLSMDHVHSGLAGLSGDQHWIEALPDLLAGFGGLLRDALDLMREMGGAEDRSDMSYMHQPSISEHPQNRHFHDWTALIDLSRDAWLAMAARSPERARLAAEGWWQVPYPLFRRLAFFAAAQGDHIAPHRALDWLLADNGWWLWSVETERETMRLLVVLAPKLDATSLAELEQAILAGPPREMFKGDIQDEDWSQIVAREIWLRLAKTAKAAVLLGPTAKKRLDALSAQYPEWQLATDERDEFPVWMGNGDEWREFVSTPRRRRELAQWLSQHPSKDHWKEDDWQQRCRDNFSTTACALTAMARDGIWPPDRWRDALQAWSEEAPIQRSWRYMGPVLANASNEVMQSIARNVSWWLRAIAKTFQGREGQFLVLCRRILMLEHQDGVQTDEPVKRAINHPVGHVTEALLRWWYRQTLEDGQGLPDTLKGTFTELCETGVEKFRHGRVLLTAHITTLFRVDRVWTTQHLLPLLEWRRSDAVARAAWVGFLWSPRLYRPLMETIKLPFLETARHYASLGKHGRPYAALLTFAALERSDTFSEAELAAATSCLPPEGLQEVAQTLVDSLEGAGNQRADYWTNRIMPYLQSIWPQSIARMSSNIAESFGRLCIATQQVFPQALARLRAWLQPLPYPGLLLHRLHESNICRLFPEQALDFLNLVIEARPQWRSSELAACLEAIRASAPALQNDPRLERLTALDVRQ
jgi:hypothetical protein